MIDATDITREPIAVQLDLTDQRNRIQELQSTLYHARTVLGAIAQGELAGPEATATAHLASLGLGAVGEGIG